MLTGQRKKVSKIPLWYHNKKKYYVCLHCLEFGLIDGSKTNRGSECNEVCQFM